MFVMVDTAHTKLKENIMNKLNLQNNVKLLAIFLSVLLVGVTGCSEASGGSAQLNKSRYVQQFTDQETGCKYLTTKDGGITPRLNAKGGHLGCHSY